MQAANDILSSDSLSYHIETDHSIQWNGQSFTHNTKQQLNVQDPGKDTMRIFMEESSSYDNFTVDLCEYYEDGNGYITISDNAFTSSFSAPDFIKRYTPAVLFDPSLYSKIEAEPLESNTKVYFSSPSAAEQWALPKDAKFTSASGYALIDKVGALQKSVYTLSYSLGDASITQTTKIYMKTNCRLTSPGNTVTYIPLACFDAPKMLEQACGYLLQAEYVHSNAKTSTNCQTFSINRTQESDLILSDSGKNLYARLDVYINQINRSRGGEITEIQQTELFENDTYSVSVNGEAATTNESINAAAMKTYCQDLLVQDILLPSHIAGVTVQEADTTITLTFQALDILAEAICSNICNTLYSDPALLHALSSDNSTQSVECTLTLHKYTGIPLSFSSQFRAHHTIEDISYQLESQTEQTYEYTKTSGQ